MEGGGRKLGRNAQPDCTLRCIQSGRCPAIRDRPPRGVVRLLQPGTLASAVVWTVYPFITIPIALYRCGDGGDRFGGIPVLEEPGEGLGQAPDSPFRGRVVP